MNKLSQRSQRKSQRIKCKYTLFNHLRDSEYRRSYTTLCSWCFLECAYYNGLSLQITSLVPVLRTEVPVGGGIGLFLLIHLFSLSVWGRTQPECIKASLLSDWGSNTKTWHLTLSSCFSVACNENFKTRWGRHIYSPTFALLRSSSRKVNN